jgi:hypothetical protein
MTHIAYEISGIPWLAVRVGRALERWGSRSARPMFAEELDSKRARVHATDAAVEARRSSLVGMYPYLR